MDFSKRCPRCGSIRPASEQVCEGDFEGGSCDYFLGSVPLLPEEPSGSTDPGATTPAGSPDTRRCVNGHEVEPGDIVCATCGGEVSAAPWRAPDDETTSPLPPQLGPAGAPTEIDGWRLDRERGADARPWRRFEVTHADGREGVLTLYADGAEPDQDVLAVLQRMDSDHVPAILATGRWEGSAYEVSERIQAGSLRDAGYEPFGTTDQITRLVDEVGRALSGLAIYRLRHRDLNPDNILVRTREPLDLVVTGFGSARLSDFDLESVAPLQLTRYSAPETIVGGVSAASDWWSLGVVVLEWATRGRCFADVDALAWRLHVVTRGISIPAELDERLRLLLRGLLARDPHQRWQWAQVRGWLAGEAVAAPPDAATEAIPAGPSIELAGRRYQEPRSFALAAAEPARWDEGKALLLRGAVTSWLEALGADGRLVASVRRILIAEELADDFKVALALMELNPAMPLLARGQIVTPGWLLEHPSQGHDIVTGPVSRWLAELQREPWLVRLRDRARTIRDRARLLEIELDEERLRVLLLATSRSRLEREREAMRLFAPDTEHRGLAPLLEHARLSDEELIVCLAAAMHQFVPLEEIVARALRMAGEANVGEFDAEQARALLVQSRRALYEQVDLRIAGFARCGRDEVDEWADAFRVERRMSLPRVAVLLAVPDDEWKKPPRQEYIAKLLAHFERRVVRAVQRGPLVRFTIGKSTPRIDLQELSTSTHPASAILSQLIRRVESPAELDPLLAPQRPDASTRLRRLVSNALTFRRDTGIDGRYLAFPFVVMRDERLTSPGRRARIAPVLLWPVVIDVPPGAAGRSTIVFDGEREEVRFNPALAGLLGREDFERWLRARDEVLARSSLRVEDVMHIFGALAEPAAQELGALPPADTTLRRGECRLHCAAALFNAEFVGQAVAEDLRGLQSVAIAGTSLSSALRVGPDAPAADPVTTTPTGTATPAEHDLFLTAASDPSQEAAVRRSRTDNGLLVQGPPGTGKSQTIVNIVSDCIGRGESVLVVCQKQAAIDVVKKRLEAEELGDRLMSVVDVNKDRRAVLQAFRDQLDRKQCPHNVLASIRRERATALTQVARLDGELNLHHRATREEDGQVGLSYRGLVSALVALDGANAIALPDLPTLRPEFDSMRRERFDELRMVMTPLAPLWQKARYEGSPLHLMRRFSADRALTQQITVRMTDLLEAERDRLRVKDSCRASYRIDDPAPYTEWLNEWEHKFATLPDDGRSRLKRWMSLFRQHGASCEGAELIARLDQVLVQAETLHPPYPAERLPRIASTLSDDELRRLSAAARRATAPVSFWDRLSIPRWFARKTFLEWLTRARLSTSEEQQRAVCAALLHELELRPLRAAVQQVRDRLGEEGDEPMVTLELVVEESARQRMQLAEAQDLVRGANACPQASALLKTLAEGTRAAPDAFVSDMRSALARCDARQASAAAVAALRDWSTQEWIRAQHVSIDQDKTPDVESLEAILRALPTLPYFQQFRARIAAIADEGTRTDVLRLFAVLRALESPLEGMDDEGIERVIAGILEREALLAWKERLERERPALVYERRELEARIALLGNVDLELRRTNRLLLGRVAQQPMNAEWDAVTRLTGPRSLRLREFFDRALPLGLLRLRPVWLMNPDTASRLLPLRAKCFDVVIFDEASQMLVEHAVPSLFRARRVVVSGDEKQMPPTSFFLGRGGDGEEEEEFDGTEWEEEMSEGERAMLEDDWNRREIKDCPDLLALGAGFLPTSTLQVHYRSKYRELIEFSNAAFYGGQLTVPARHPDDEIRRIRPIEVIRVDGLYHGQTNADEARRVVEELARIWRDEGDAPPSIGVVTFNRKQADLVEDEIERRAEADDAFRRSYVRERDRVQGGEDMGFFVKNVENVQGDERDIILFSTTFGRDKGGAFKRFFGVLGQVGGERRLNVAVTRAREKVILVTSMPVSDVSDFLQANRRPSGPRDYLQAYLDYAAKISDGDLEAARALCRRLLPDGGSEHRREGEEPDAIVRAVAEFLVSRGSRVKLGADNDTFTFDIGVVDPRTGQFVLAVECDAPDDRHGHLRAAKARELWRPAVIRRAIPMIHRVTCKGWYERREEEEARLMRALQQALGEMAA